MRSVVYDKRERIAHVSQDCPEAMNGYSSFGDLKEVRERLSEFFEDGKNA